MSFDLRLVLEEVAEMMAPRAAEKGLDLVVDYPAGIPGCSWETATESGKLSPT